jgi:hypothetical protein
MIKVKTEKTIRVKNNDYKRIDKLKKKFKTRNKHDVISKILDIAERWIEYERKYDVQNTK